MKRSLVSLAALALASSARSQAPVALFGAPEVPPLELRPMRIGRLLNDPDPEALRAVQAAVREHLASLALGEDSRVEAVGSFQAGKTAALKLHSWQIEAAEQARKHSAWATWPPGYGRIPLSPLTP